MSDKNWYLHVSGEALGPLSTSLLTKMISENRANAADYVWCDGMKTWTPIAACEELTDALPQAPRVPIPKTTTVAKPVAAAKPAATPKPAAAVKRPAPVRAPEPEPEPEVEEVEAVAEQVVAEQEPVEEAPAPKPVAKPAAKPAVKPVAAKPAAIKPVAKKPPAPKVKWRVPLDMTVRVAGGAAVNVLDLTEGGLKCEPCEAEAGTDAKIVLEAPSIGKPLELNALVMGEDTADGKPALAIEFTRMNPAHRRTLEKYLSEHLNEETEQAA